LRVTLDNPIKYLDFGFLVYLTKPLRYYINYNANESTTRRLTFLSALTIYNLGVGSTQPP
jgi:hypothetical protein